MSRRLALLNLALRLAVRPLLARTKTPEQAERDFARASLIFPGPPGTRIEKRSVPGPAGQIPVTRIENGSAADKGAILFFHGGGFVAGSAATHRGLLGRLSRLSGYPVEAPDYRLAFRAPLPAALDDAVAVWDALLAEGHAPSRLVLAGDSAGGGLALALLAAVSARGTPPAGLFAFSPWTDLTLSGASHEENAASDALFPPGRTEDLLGFILGEVSAGDPRISPLFASFPHPVPIYLQASRTEILRDDTLRMAEVLRAASCPVEVELWDDAPHVWQLFDGWIPEARDANEKAAAFAVRCLKAPSPQSEN